MDSNSNTKINEDAKPVTKSKKNASNKGEKQGEQQHDLLLFQSSFGTKIPKNHITIGLSNSIAQNNQFQILFQHKRLPANGWSDFQIQSLIMMLSTLDTNHIAPLCNNTASMTTASGGGNSGGSSRWCGIGEREGRVYSNLVCNRHFGLSHGVGRSGDITEPQPKAVGSSILAELTRCLVLDVMKRGCGLDASTFQKNKKQHSNANDVVGGSEGGPVRFGIVLPLCTGMSMSLILSSLRAESSSSQQSTKKEGESSGNKDIERDIVLWSRIDQKSCFKAIVTTGLKCIVVPTKVDEESDQVITDLEKMEELMTNEIYRHRILGVVSTTSCFAPRVSDSVDEIGKLCQTHDIAHIINNAYGLQCQKTCKLINRACVVGRVDAMVCSTDKNFLVPVGGAIVTSPREDVIQGVGKVYPGRASSAPVLDLFITLLSMGLNGYKHLLDARRENIIQFEKRLNEVASKYGERQLKCPKNTISFGITLDSLSQHIISSNDSDDGQKEELENRLAKKKAEITSLLGSMLFTRCVSGTRVVSKHQTKTICGEEFVGFGSSTDDFPHAYLTAACAIGLSREELDEFFTRLDKCFKDFFAKRKKDDKRKAKETLTK